ncbi:MAG: hypothetical protein HC811_05290 [Flammeovirgaceae bacterium]|nr:hypothetical protein [Flammeovirgaceae bacterium]
MIRLHSWVIAAFAFLHFSFLQPSAIDRLTDLINNQQYQKAIDEIDRLLLQKEISYEKQDCCI